MWMAEYAAGNKAAFERLFAALAPRVHAFFVRSFRDRSVADDLLQQTFMKLHRARSTYRTSSPIRPWLFTIAASVRRDELRRRYRLPEHVQEDDWERLEVSTAREEDASAGFASGGDAADAMRSALESLPETQRIVVHLHRYEEMTFEQIAQALGSTPGAMRVRASRAYERLRAKLRPQLQPRDDLADRGQP